MPRQHGRGAAVNEAGGGIQCAQCGTTNMSVSAFCHACGLSLRRTGTPTTPPTWQPAPQGYTPPFVPGGQGSPPPYESPAGSGMFVPPSQGYAPPSTPQPYAPPMQSYAPANPPVQGYAQPMNPQPYGQPQAYTPITPGYGASYETPANPYGQPMPASGSYPTMPPPSAYAPYGQPISINVNPTMTQTMYPMPAQPPPPSVVMVQDGGARHSLVVRALWFLVFGVWLGAFATVLGWLLCVMVITLPVGLMLLNRLPQIMTLRPPSAATTVSYANGVTLITTNVAARQPAFLLRAVYFLLIGWWLSALWLTLAWAFVAATPITLGMSLVPAFMMFNNLPQVMTLRAN